MMKYILWLKNQDFVFSGQRNLWFDAHFPVWLTKCSDLNSPPVVL